MIKSVAATSHRTGAKEKEHYHIDPYMCVGLAQVCPLHL